VQAISEEGIATDLMCEKLPIVMAGLGPRFVNEGIWKDVHLVTWDNARIEHLHIAQKTITAGVALLEAQIDVIADHDQPATISIDGALISSSIQTSDNKSHAETHIQLTTGPNHLSLPLEIVHPALWYPVGYGEQSRYDFDAVLAGEATRDMPMSAPGCGLSNFGAKRMRSARVSSFWSTVSLFLRRVRM